MTCIKCGATLPEGSIFCSNCGQKVKSSDSAAAADKSRFFQAGTLDNQIAVALALHRERSTNSHKEPTNRNHTKPITKSESCTASTGSTAARRFCRKCGATISNGSAFCSNCGFCVNSTKIPNKLIPVRVGALEQFARKHMKVIITSVAVCLVLIIAIVLLNRGGIKSERGIIEDIGEDITVISLGDERIQLYIKDLEIEKRKTKDDVDQVYCKIELECDDIAVTSYQLLTYSRYNGNKWLLESVSPYEAEEIEILKATPVMYGNVVERIDYSGGIFEDFSSMIADYTVTCSGTTVEYRFDISKTTGILSITGTVYATSKLYGSHEEGYYWLTNVDADNVSSRWNVEGTWSGFVTNYGTGRDELTITIYDLTADAVNCSWNYYCDTGMSKHNYSGDGAYCWIIESDNEKIEIGVRYGTELLSCLYVYFYANGTAQVMFPFIGVGNMTRS